MEQVPLTAPRLEIDLDKIRDNARTLVERLGAKGIGVTGITKAMLGSAAVAAAMVDAGVGSLGDSRVENLAALRAAGSTKNLTLIRSPMLSQVDLVVEHADTSCNSELEVIEQLSSSACRQGRTHGVLLMVELGDLREGVLAADLVAVARQTHRLPNLALVGLGTNLACQSGVAPDEAKMAELTRLVEAVEADLCIELAVVSGGNSANLTWALSPGVDAGRVNDLRLGESILLGRETLHRQPVVGLHTDAITLFAEVIESKTKPAQPWGEIAQTAFGEPVRRPGSGTVSQALLALGHQDADPDGLTGPPGVRIQGASSDHLVVDAGESPLAVGDEIAFGVNYAALLRAMTSPYVAKVYRGSAGVLR